MDAIELPASCPLTMSGISLHVGFTNEKHHIWASLHRGILRRSTVQLCSEPLADSSELYYKRRFDRPPMTSFDWSSIASFVPYLADLPERSSRSGSRMSMIKKMCIKYVQPGLDETGADEVPPRGREGPVVGDGRPAKRAKNKSTEPESNPFEAKTTLRARKRRVVEENDDDEPAMDTATSGSAQGVAIGPTIKGAQFQNVAPIAPVMTSQIRWQNAIEMLKTVNNCQAWVVDRYEKGMHELGYNHNWPLRLLPRGNPLEIRTVEQSVDGDTVWADLHSQLRRCWLMRDLKEHNEIFEATVRIQVASMLIVELQNIYRQDGTVQDIAPIDLPPSKAFADVCSLFLTLETRVDRAKDRRSQARQLGEKDLEMLEMLESPEKKHDYVEYCFKRVIAQIAVEKALGIYAANDDEDGSGQHLKKLEALVMLDDHEKWSSERLFKDA